jgi:hypothetical protein
VATGDSGREAYTAIAWGVGLSHERSDIAGAESFYSLEGDMCGAAMRGAVALPGSKATSRAKGSHRKLGGLVSGRRSGDEPHGAFVLDCGAFKNMRFALYGDHDLQYFYFRHQFLARPQTQTNLAAAFHD